MHLHFIILSRFSFTDIGNSRVSKTKKDDHSYSKEQLSPLYQHLYFASDMSTLNFGCSICNYQTANG